MKKCKCGKEIDEKWDECYTCNQKKPKETTDDRTASIERQVAAKCAASAAQGQLITEEQLTKTFNHFLKLIRGENA